MKASLSWLKEYVNVTADDAEIARKLTFAGLEIEGVNRQSKGFEKVVVGQILERKQHPNADRLSLCKVTVGTAAKPGEDPYEIVCGAQNIKAGDRIPVAMVGAIIPNGLEIKPAKIRGVASSGMLCSADELLLQKPASQKEDGIYILPNDAPIGKNFAAYLGLDDTLLEVNVTPNRGDALSHIGVARDVAALFGKELRWPELEVKQKEEKSIKVENQVGEACPVYWGAAIEGVKIGPSPDWLRQRLEAVGLRSINNVVDATAFVMLEMGQPLHAFDQGKLPGGKTIGVRFAKAGEDFTTLTQKQLKLQADDLVITSGGTAVALAGVMGGGNSEVDDSTKNIFLESAVFAPAYVRRTSRRNQLITDASYRFERGVDVTKTEWALLRAASLITKLAGGKFLGSQCSLETKKTVAAERPRIRLRTTDVLKLLGKAPDASTQAQILQSLGFGVEPAAGEAGVFNVVVPPWRTDVTRTVDLVEETIRIWGFEQLESRLPLGAVAADEGQRNRYFQVRRTRRHLCSLGFSEALNLGFTSRDALEKVHSAQELEKTVSIMNPLSADFTMLKPSLAVGLLQNVAHNQAHRRMDVRLFEVRRVFRTEDAGNDPKLKTGVQETLRLGLVATGAEIDQYWQGTAPAVDFYSLKGVLESLLEMLGKGGVAFRASSEGPSYLHPGQSAVLAQGKRVLGYVGRLHPRVEKTWGFAEPVYLAEVDLENILSEQQLRHRFKPYSKFPEVERDFSALVADSVTADAIRDLVAKTAKPLLKEVRFFDVYKGSRVPAGHVSYAFRIRLGSSERTLTDEEINQVQANVMQALEKDFGAKFAGQA